ncbi:MAG: hypothetical protein ACYCUT_10325 [bacterium]
MKKLLKIKLFNEKRVKPIKFKAGNHRFSTNLLTLLSYINYLKKSGYDIKIKVVNKKSLLKLKSKDIIITLNKIADIGVAFSLLKTFGAFPSELRKISIKSRNGMNIVINERLIGLT